MVASKAETQRWALMLSGYALSTQAATHAAKGGVERHGAPFMVGDIQLPVLAMSLAVTTILASFPSVDKALLLTKKAAKQRTMMRRVSVLIFLNNSI